MPKSNEDVLVHDLLNALTVIIAHCQMLQLNPHNQVERRTAIMLQTAQAMNRMIAERNKVLPTAS
jgi:hypothetical protein